MGLFGKRERMRATIGVEPKVVAPGQEVEITIVLEGADPELAELTAGLVCEGSWDDIGDATDAVRDRVFSFHHDLRPIAIAPGTQVIRATVPADGPPTAYLYLRHHARWTAVVRGRGRKLVHAAAPLVVTADPERCRAREAIPPTVAGSDAVQIDVDRPRTMWTAWPFEGAVRLTARRSATVERVRVRLVQQLVWAATDEGEAWDASTPVDDPRGKTSGYGQRSGYRQDIPVDAPLAVGQPREIPFSVTPDPDGMYPTFVHPLARSHWLLVVEVQLAGEPAATVTMELNVASQPRDDYR